MKTLTDNFNEFKENIKSLTGIKYLHRIGFEMAAIYFTSKLLHISPDESLLLSNLYGIERNKLEGTGCIQYLKQIFR